MVGTMRFELTRISPLDSESSAYTIPPCPRMNNIIALILSFQLKYNLYKR